jgi:hypothetical protein
MHAFRRPSATQTKSPGGAAHDHAAPWAVGLSRRNITAGVAAGSGGGDDQNPCSLKRPSVAEAD